MKKSLFGVIGLAILLLSCGNKKELERLKTQNAELEATIQRMEDDLKTMQESDAKLRFLANKLDRVKARIITDFGNMEFKLFPDLAPIHCFAFVTRAESGFYDNVAFHRVMKNFMIQTGDPNSKDDNPADDGLGGPLIAIPHEFNSKKHVKGVLSTARIPDKSAGAGSQFFIMHGTAPHLDNDYTVFGEMTKGFDVLDKIANTETHTVGRAENRPVKTIRVKTIEVYF